MARNALVSDFDGTITRNDFYTLIAERYMGPDAMGIWSEYRSGRLTHFDAMQAFFSHAPDDQAALEFLIRDTYPDPGLEQSVKTLQSNGWDLIIVSAGSSWYIDRILANHNIKATVHSNPGSIVPGKGLVLRPPRESPFFCPDVGIDKQAVMRDALQRYERVAFAGDGPPDIAPALLAGPELRFARGFLARELSSKQLPFLPFGRWSDIAGLLLTAGNTPMPKRIP